MRNILNIFSLRNQDSEIDYVKTIAASSVTYAIASVLSAVVSFFSIPLIIASVGTEAYGLFVLITAFAGFLGFVDLGLLTTLVNKVSYLKAERNFTAINRLIGGCYLFLAGAVSIVIVLGIGVMLWDAESIMRSFNVNSELQPIVLALLSIVVATWIVNHIFAGILRSLYAGLNQLPYYNYINLLFTIIYGISFLSFLLLKPTLIAIATFLLIAGAVRFSLLYYNSRKVFPAFKIQPAYNSVQSVLPLLTYAPSLVLLSIVALSISKSDVLAVSHFVGLSALALYAAAYKLFKIPADVIKVSDTALPSASELYQKGDLETIRHIYERVLRINLTLRIGTLAALAVYGQEILILWLGDGFLVSNSLLWTLLFLFVGFGWTAPHVVLAQAFFLYKKLVVPSVLYLAMTVGFMIILIPEFGIVGAPLGIGIANLLTNGLYLPLFLKRYINITPFRTGAKFFFAIAPALLFLILFRYLVIPHLHSSALTITVAVLSTISYFTMILFLGLNGQERKFLYRKIGNLFRIVQT